MTYLLLQAIKDVLEKGFAQTVFRQPPADPESYAPPTVYLGNLPAKRTSPEQGQDFPFIVVLLDEITDGEEMSVAHVDIVCGVFTAEDDPEAGMHDCLNMIDRSRRLLMEQDTLDAQFVLQKPIKSAISRQDEKLTPRPHYLGWLGVTYILPMVHQVFNINREGGSYGEE